MPEVGTATRVAVIEGLHDGSHKGVIYVTGGGSLILSDLLQVPGASATLLEARIPYAQAALTSLLGEPPEQACSAETARDLAMCAFLRAKALDPDAQTFGLAITASLRSTRPKRGEHRAWCAVQTSARTHTTWLHLAKGARSREEEERFLADIALATLAQALGIDPPAANMLEADTLRTRVAEGDADMQALLSGSCSAISTHTGPPKAILPGAFNPLHEGHRRMAAAAASRLGEPVAYELCVRNVDKPPLNFHDMRVRREQFSGSEEVWLTNASTFLEKARVFGRVTFVVGADTIMRVADPWYYEDGDVDAAVEELAAAGCRFLVFGRLLGGVTGADAGENFVELDALDLPERLRELCDGFGEAEFRSDISSTALRARKTNDG
ncbi:MAG: hypothetical protein OXQ84_17680 [bacterium]|nr:hypothetical protein [bacterium]